MSVRISRVVVNGGVAVFLAAIGGAAVYTSGLQTVRIEDRCDPASFNAAIGAGTCVKINRGGTHTFDEFVASTVANGGDPKWRFHPDEFHVKRGDSINSTNIGGEFHTFTPVANFGPGVVPILNDLSGITGPPVGECIADASVGFANTGVPPGATSDPMQLNTVGTTKIQCCIHPWMRSEVEVRKK